MFGDDTTQYILGGITAALATAVGWVYKGADKRMTATEETVKTKADKEDFERHQKHIEKLFGEITEVRKDMNGGFESIRKDMHKAHIDLVERLPRKP